MHDHGLFQAICRVNRLDDESKDFGYIVDYKQLFGDLADAINTYTAGAFEDYDPEDVEGLIKDRTEEAKKYFLETLDALDELCEGVAMPRAELDYIHYFCGENGVDLDNDEAFARSREKLYKLVSRLVRAFSEFKPRMDDAEISSADQAKFDERVNSTAKTNPILRPSRCAIGRVGVPLARKEQKHIAGTHCVTTRRRGLQLALTLNDIDQLILLQHSSSFGAEHILAIVQRRRILLARLNALKANRADHQPPTLVGEVLRYIFYRFHNNILLTHFDNRPARKSAHSAFTFYNFNHFLRVGKEFRHFFKALGQKTKYKSRFLPITLYKKV